jgi:hypothetical protein
MGGMKTVILALITGLGVFALVWWRVRIDAIKVWRGLPATFTPPDSHGKPVPFEHRHERYMNLAEPLNHSRRHRCRVLAATWC